MLRALVLIALLATTAHAEPWYGGKDGRTRILRLSLSTVGLVAYPLMNGLEEEWAPDACRWCDPTSLDVAVRDALLWDDLGTAKTLSDVGTFGVTPAVSIGLVLTGTFADPSWSRTMDDVLPIVESMVVTQWVTRAFKLSFGRQRPHAHYVGPTDGEDNLSFPSGHTSRAFALATSAGMVARLRGYAAEPYVWATGLTLAAASGYFRIAADRHYVTDVVAGAALGVVVGLTVPWLTRRSDVDVSATRDGMAFGGTW